MLKVMTARRRWTESPLVYQVREDSQVSDVVWEREKTAWPQRVLAWSVVVSAMAGTEERAVGGRKKTQAFEGLGLIHQRRRVEETPVKDISRGFNLAAHETPEIRC